MIAGHWTLYSRQHEARESPGNPNGSPGAPRRLFVFTSDYPYGKGEQFLETEVPYLATAFETVVLVPRGTAGPARAIPANTVVHTTLSRSRSGKWPGAVRASAELLLGRHFWLELKSRWTRLRSLAAWRRLVSNYSDAIHARDWILAAYRGGDLDASDVIYTYWLGGTTLGALMAKQVIPELRVISRAHGIDLYEERSVPPYLPFRLAMLTGVECVHAVSDNGASYLRRRWPKARDRVRVSRLGVRDPMFEALPSPDGVFRIVSCSFVIAIKRLDLLVAALGDLACRLPNQPMEWTHLGDGPMRAHLAQRASLELPANVQSNFLGELSNREVLDFYYRNPVDVFVNVSASEGIPVSIMEAQSFAIPVVATSVGGTPEIVHSENGYLLSENPPVDEISHALEAFVPGSAGVASRRIASKATWREGYNAAINYAAFIRELSGRDVNRSSR